MATHASSTMAPAGVPPADQPNATTNKLVDEIRLACGLSNISLTTFGVIAANDRSFVQELAAGRNVRPATIRKIQAAIRRLASMREAASG